MLIAGPSMDKAALRAELKARRARAAAQLAKAGEALAWRVPAALLERNVTVAAGYAPFGDEIEPGGALFRFRQAGARMALPVVVAEGAPLIFRAWSFGEPLEPGAYGVPAPPESAEQVTPDLVLVPLLGWSQDGARLGSGKGFYDRTLAGLRAAGPRPDGAPPVTAVGLGFEAQRVWGLPVERHDEPLDWIITESAAYEAVGSDPAP